MKTLIAIFILGISASVYAQTPVANIKSKLEFDINDAATSADAESRVYRYYEAASIGIILIGVKCTGPTTTTPPHVVCQAPIPHFTDGTHTITMTDTNADGESLMSEPFTFIFKDNILAAPVNIRITAP